MYWSKRPGEKLLALDSIWSSTKRNQTACSASVEVARRVFGQPAAGGGDAFQFLRTWLVAALRQFRC
jgi:hypothetical protein